MEITFCSYLSAIKISRSGICQKHLSHHSEALDRIFNTFGLPESADTDKGPPFTSHTLKTYFQEGGVYNRGVTPIWPQVNTEAERSMKLLKKTIQTSHIENQD